MSTEGFKKINEIFHYKIPENSVEIDFENMF